MPDRPHLTRTLALALAAAAVLAGCSTGLYEFPTEPGTAKVCRAVVDAAPDSVAGQAATPVDSDRVAAWGDPRIVLRCGVTRPEALKPTSRCDDVDGVGWFAEKHEGGQLFTTVGREPSISVEVPASIEPAATALLDVAEVVKQHTTETNPCY